MKSNSVIRSESDGLKVARSSVLVVEDEVITRITLGQNLRDLGHDVIETSNADEALVVFEATLPDIIVTDIRMPGSVDGIDLCSTVHKIYPELPVIIVSAHLDPDVHGCDPHTKFFPKPYSIVELVEAVQSTLATPSNFASQHGPHI